MAQSRLRSLKSRCLSIEVRDFALDGGSPVIALQHLSDLVEGEPHFAQKHYDSDLFRGIVVVSSVSSDTSRRPYQSEFVVVPQRRDGNTGAFCEGSDRNHLTSSPLEMFPWSHEPGAKVDGQVSRPPIRLPTRPDRQTCRVEHGHAAVERREKPVGSQPA